MIIDTLQLKAGDSVELDFTIQNTDGTLADLSGATIRWGLAPFHLNPDFTTKPAPVLTLTLSSGITVPSAGVVRVTVGKGQIPAGRFEHELEITLPSGVSFTPIEGEIRSRAAIFGS